MKMTMKLLCYLGLFGFGLTMAGCVAPLPPPPPKKQVTVTCVKNWYGDRVCTRSVSN